MNLWVYKLKFTLKRLIRESKHLERNVQKESVKVKKALLKGNMLEARIHAEEAIKQKHRSRTTQKLIDQLGLANEQIKKAMMNKTVTKPMVSVVSMLDIAMKSNNLARIEEAFNKFNSLFENVNIQTQFKDRTITEDGTSPLLAEVEALLAKTKAEVEEELRKQSSLTGKTVVDSSDTNAPSRSVIGSAENSYQ